MIAFIERHMHYYCGNRAKIAFGKFDCLRGALMSDHHCWQHIEDMSSPTDGAGKCNGISRFFDCALPGVLSKCQTTAVHILVDAITSFGCPLSRELVQQSANYIKKLNDTGEFTEEAGRQFIRSELPAALPVLDEERNARPSIQRYTIARNNFVKFHSPTSAITSGTKGSMNASKAFGRSNETISTNGLFNPSFNKKKQNFDYRRSPSRKIDPNLDYVEENTFLESDPSIEIAFDDDGKAVSIAKTEFTCTKKQEERIAQCYAPMIEFVACELYFYLFHIDDHNSQFRLWNRIQDRYKSSDNILLPFLNYHPKQLSDLCDLLDVIFDNCLTADLINDCQGNNVLMEFVDEHFGIICSKTGAENLFESFACLRKVIAKKKECTDIIRHSDAIGTVHCNQMSGFFDCLLDTLQQECTPETLLFFADVISNFGCMARLNNYKLGTERAFAKQKNVDQTRDAGFEKKKIDPKIGSETHSVEILDGELFSYQLSRECTQEMQSRTRVCVQPLMLAWNNMRQQRPILKNASFPLYKYTSEELLELCDGYVNIFLCAGFESITICLNDELVRFARDHFGYICTPQNIGRFMNHYECIMKVAAAYGERCEIFIAGTAEPGKDLRKCRGIRQYYDCMKPGIIQNCRAEALKEFATSVTEYGCDLNVNDLS
uniref:Uncharacterized protein n=1 Tax=Setaria digitata TaxID=48799 RepID=A0A915PYF9_9BILA